MGNLCGASANKKAVVQEPAEHTERTSLLSSYQSKQNVQTTQIVENTKPVEPNKEPEPIKPVEPKIEENEPKVEPIVDEPISPPSQQNDGLTDEQRKEMEEEQKRLEEEARLFEQEEKLAEEERLKKQEQELQDEQNGLGQLEIPSTPPLEIIDSSMTPRTVSGILSRRASFKMRYELAKQLEEKIEEEERKPVDDRRASVVITDEIGQLQKMEEEEEEERRQLEERRRKRAQLFFRSQSISSSPQTPRSLEGTDSPPPAPPQPDAKPIEKRAKSEVLEKKPKQLAHTHSMQSQSGVTLNDIEEKRTHLKSSQSRETEEDVWKNVFK